MNGRQLRNALKAIDIVNHDQIRELLKLEYIDDENYIPLEDMLPISYTDEQVKALTKEEVVDVINPRATYGVSEYTTFKGNGELNLGLQVYREESNSELIALVTLGVEPNLMREEQVVTAFWFEDSKIYNSWLRKKFLVNKIDLGKNRTAEIHGYMNKLTAEILVFEENKEIGFVILPLNLKDSSETIIELADAIIEKTYRAFNSGLKKGYVK